MTQGFEHLLGIARPYESELVDLVRALLMRARTSPSALVNDDAISTTTRRILITRRDPNDHTMKEWAVAVDGCMAAGSIQKNVHRQCFLVHRPLWDSNPHYNTYEYLCMYICMYVYYL